MELMENIPRFILGSLSFMTSLEISYGKKNNHCKFYNIQTVCSFQLDKRHGTLQPGGLLSMGSQRVRHDLATEQQQQLFV